MLARDPGDDVVQTDCQVTGARGEVVVAGTSIFNPWIGDEVEIRLPHLTVVLVIIGEGRCFDEGMLILVHTQIGVDLGQVRQQLVGCGEGVWSALLEQVLSDVGHYKKCRPQTMLG